MKSQTCTQNHQCIYDFSGEKGKRKKQQLQGKLLERESFSEKKCGPLVSHKKMRGF